MTLTELKYIVAVIVRRKGRGAPLAGIDPAARSLRRRGGVSKARAPA